MAPPSRKISAIDFDRVLQHVGPLGPWQYCHAFLLFLVSFLLDYNECCSAPSQRFLNRWMVHWQIFFRNFLKVEIIKIPFPYILEKINKNYDRK